MVIVRAFLVPLILDTLEREMPLRIRRDLDDRLQTGPKRVSGRALYESLRSRR